jgi:tetratricopeptide (TPR) repeat protein
MYIRRHFPTEKRQYGIVDQLGYRLMKPTVALLALLACSAVVIGPASAHDPAQHPGAVTGELGTTHFSNSGARAAQPAFLRGLLLLHSFEYAAARQSFQAAERTDPGFAMAYWGEALTYNHPLWGEQNLDAAHAALAKLAASPPMRAAKAPTARERAYLGSVEQLYGAGDKIQRDANYSAALGTLAEKYPDDLDARAFYALSLMGLTGGSRNIANYLRAAAEAEAVLKVDPLHPGALHYLIHGLPAARLYGKVAPAAAHAQHMPSHIFFALGMWDDAIAANSASLQTARAQGDRAYHALLWLTYAYLQEDKRQDAEPLIRSVAQDVAAAPTEENRARLSYARAMWLVETRGAQGPDAYASVDNDGVASINYFAAHDFAVGITAAAGNTTAARAALARLRSRIDAARAPPHGVTADWLDNVTPQELEEATILANALDGAIQFYAGDRTAGIARVRAAIAAADHLVFEYGPPWSVKPLTELLGELLLADGRRDEAAAAFEQTLAVYPNRRLAREGLAASHIAHTTRQELIGAWRLLSIEVTGPNGPMIDPFYHADSTGILIYDPSGWMSVQIAGHPRPAMQAPESRPTPTEPAQQARLKAAVLDTYYAYFGTWEYDEATSTVTHHVQSSLIPGEAGKSYAQAVALDGGRLSFTVPREIAGERVLQTKVWERLQIRTYK